VVLKADCYVPRTDMALMGSQCRIRGKGAGGRPSADDTDEPDFVLDFPYIIPLV
jgi:hypothetical protein